MPNLPFSELDRAVAAWTASGDGVGPEWDPYRTAVFDLPDWYDHSLSPFNDEYRAQQLRLWSEVSQFDRYNADANEQADEISRFDAVRRPGFYARRDEAAIRTAAEHIMATGHILAHSGLKAGDRALEYGAGFGQAALTLARLGVKVDTVDINQHFCDAITAQAQFFGVDMTSHKGEFGLNPRPSEKYNLIMFYEAFHHCLEFENLIRGFRQMLTQDGRVILCGEPIVDAGVLSIPYPWGLRMDAANLVVVRIRGWLELGFQKSFIFDLFGKHGFEMSERVLPGFHYAHMYVADRQLTDSSIISIFREYLGRDPEPAALAAYKRFDDIETVRAVVAQSPEARDRLSQ
jgi:2-polyprenyl-3-methyl-5-hydroxy-6-metoxy-1,4-benzoquinol methylase